MTPPFLFDARENMPWRHAMYAANAQHVANSYDDNQIFQKRNKVRPYTVRGLDAWEHMQEKSAENYFRARYHLMRALGHDHNTAVRRAGGDE